MQRIPAVWLIGALAMACDAGVPGESDAGDTGGARDTGVEDDGGGGGVSCQVDDDCADDTYCAFADAAALTGTCAEGCRVEPDTCEAPAACDPETHTCGEEPGGGCEADDDCAEGQGCVDGECVDGACRLDGSDCDDGAACNPESRECQAMGVVEGACCLPDGACSVMPRDQ